MPIRAFSWEYPLLGGNEGHRACNGQQASNALQLKTAETSGQAMYFTSLFREMVNPEILVCWQFSARDGFSQVATFGPWLLQQGRGIN